MTTGGLHGTGSRRVRGGGPGEGRHGGGSSGGLALGAPRHCPDKDHHGGKGCPAHAPRTRRVSSQRFIRSVVPGFRARKSYVS
jgi:hypothetical protein